MAWVRTIGLEEAEGVVKEEYDRQFQWANLEAREVPEVISVFSLRSELLQARVGFAKTMTFGGSGLGRYREELIATSISQLLGCKF
jgi:hypothetical protein